MKKVIRILSIVLLLIFMSGDVAGYEIDYKDFKGARRKNPDTGNWEVGWEVTRTETPDSNLPAVKGLEGVTIKKFNRTAKGNQNLKANELDLDKDKGFELPLLGIKSDFYIMTKMNANAPIRFYADDQSIAQEWWVRGPYSYYGSGNHADQLAWLRSDGGTEERLKREVGRPSFIMNVRTAPFDSRWLDSNKDGYWKPETAIKIRNYQLPVTLEYIIFLPATTVDVPMQEEWKKGAKVEFKYLTPKGPKEASFLLDPDFMPEKGGKLRIGFVNSKYVVQNPGKGKEGIIIGRLDNGLKNGRLTIVPGSLKIEKAKWIPYDRIHVDKRKWIGKEGTPDNDFASFDDRPNRDWGYLMSYRGYGRKVPGRNFPIRNEFNRISHDQAVRLKKDTLRIAYKYGMRIALDIGDQISPENYIPDQYKAEILDPETKKFVKAPFLDWANPEAVAWETENIKRRVMPFKGVVTYIKVHEGFGMNQTENKSIHALKNFREFVKDPKAKFPVVPTCPNTDRTTNTPTAEEIERYKIWKLGYYRGKMVMQAYLRAGYQALEGCGPFKGIGYFGHVGDGGAHFIPYFADAKEVAMLCPEIVLNSDQTIFKVWLDAVKKSKGRIVLLPHSYPMLITSSTDRFIEWFEDVGLHPEVDGLLLGGGGLEPKALFDALAAKHFGRGRMSIEEAERRIKIAKERGIFHLDNYSDKKLKYHMKTFAKSKPFKMKTAKRAPAVKKKIYIDGDLSDWQEIPWNKVKSDKNLLFDKDWDGREDLSCTFATAYDSDYLYLAAKVMDDKLVSRDLTLGECADEINLFVGFIKNPQKEKLLLNQNAFQFRVFPSEKHNSLYLGHSYPDAVPGSKAKVRKTEEGYQVEVAVPLKKYKFKPEKGNLMPLELYLIDADEPGGNPSASMVWNMFKGKKAPWKASEQWGLVELK